MPPRAPVEDFAAISANPAEKRKPGSNLSRPLLSDSVIPQVVRNLEQTKFWRLIPNRFLTAVESVRRSSPCFPQACLEAGYHLQESVSPTLPKAPHSPSESQAPYTHSESPAEIHSTCIEDSPLCQLFSWS